jgi:SAM-dependent methyltransferase
MGRARLREDDAFDARNERKRATRARLSAATADRHVLYEASVQSVEFEANFLRKLYRKKRGRPFRLLREDFCGTAALACEWVRRHRENRAIGVDLHGPTLQWGLLHHVMRLRDAADRIALIQGNVLTVEPPKVDVVVAFNYSYGVFKERKILRRYFGRVLQSLKPGGMLVLDSFGGTAATEAGEEERKIASSIGPDGQRIPAFTYVWEQRHFNPLTFDLDCRIHFRFTDGTTMRNAFHYDWRYWTIPELKELMLEAGFAAVEVYLEGWDDEKDEATGIFRERADVEEMAGWVGYVVGLKK